MRFPVLVFFVLLAGGGAAAGQQGSLRLPSPFHKDPGAALAASPSVLPLELDADRVGDFRAAFESDRSVLVDGFALPDRLVSLSLRPVRSMPKGAVARVMSETGESTLAPSIAMFQGHVPGVMSNAFLALSATQFHGYFQVDGELWILSSGPTADAHGVVAHASMYGGEASTLGFCHAIQTALQGSTAGGGYAGAPGAVQQADLYIELDDQFRGLFSTNQDAIDYGELLMTATHEIYRRDLGVLMTVPSGFMRLWTTTPPWGPITTFNDISNVQGWWDSPANPQRNLARAAVHVFSTPVFGGVAYYPAACNDAFSYAISTVYGFFPYPIQHTSNDNWDLLVVNHEFGHVFGSPHTFDYSPPISCTDGSGPDNGTLMGYCHQNTGGVSNVGMRFHARVQSMMRSFLGTVSCLTPVPFIPGDYDLSGVLDAADLAALDACLLQGFDSSGCLDAFDMNLDGQLDRCDYALLDAAIQGTSLGLYAAPLLPDVGDSVTIGLCGALPGTIARFATLEVGGVPFFQFIAAQPVDGAGNASLSGNVPASLAGLNVQFLGVSVNTSGSVALTNVASMNVQ